MKTRIIAIMAAAVLVAPITPSPAQASAGSVEFVCSGVLPIWAAPSATSQCSGSAAGATLAPRFCAPTCTFYMSIQYGDVCLLNEPPLLGTMEGEMFVDGESIGWFAATRVGTQLIFAGGVVGHGNLILTSIPLGTCGAARPQSFTMTGTVVGMG